MTILPARAEKEKEKMKEEEEKEMSMGDLADEEAWRQQRWLENAKEDDEHNERDHLKLVRCELCNKLFYFDGFCPQWCEECCEDCQV